MSYKYNSYLNNLTMEDEIYEASDNEDCEVEIEKDETDQHELIADSDSGEDEEFDEEESDESIAGSESDSEDLDEEESDDLHDSSENGVVGELNEEVSGELKDHSESEEENFNERCKRRLSAENHRFFTSKSRRCDIDEPTTSIQKRKKGHTKKKKVPKATRAEHNLKEKRRRDQISFLYRTLGSIVHPNMKYSIKNSLRMTINKIKEYKVLEAKYDEKTLTLEKECAALEQEALSLQIDTRILESSNSKKRLKHHPHSS